MAKTKPEIMNAIIRHALLALIAGMLLNACCPCKRISVTEYDSVDMETVIYHLKSQYDKAIDSLSKLKIQVQLTEASANLKILKTQEAGGEIKIWILKPSYKYSQENATSITFNMALPNKKGWITKGIFSRIENNDICNVIVSTAKEFAKIPLNPIDSLEKKSFDIEVAFTIRHEKGVNFEFNVPGISSIGADYSKSRQVEHSISLSFKPINTTK